MAKQHLERVFQSLNFNPTAAPGGSASNSGTWREMLNRILHKIGAVQGNNWYDSPPTTLTDAKTHMDDVTGDAHGGSYVEIWDHGTPMTRARKLNFLGSGVTLAHNGVSGATEATITGGTGGTGADHNLLSTTHLDVNAADVPTDGDILLRSGGQWLADRIAHGNVAAANIDGTTGTPSMRTLGTTAGTAAAGNDTRFHTQVHSLLSTDHDDVTVTVPNHGDVLGYDGPTTNWVAVPNPAASVYVSPALIEGLVPRWDGANTITIKTGAAWIPGINKVLELSADFQRPISWGTASQSTFQYLYIYESSPGVAGIEVSLVAPTTYHGKAKHQTGDTNRRYIGAVLGNGQATTGMQKFRWAGPQKVMYLENLNVSPFRILNNSTISTETSANCAPVVPPTSRLAQMHLYNNSSNFRALIGSSEDNLNLANSVYLSWLEIGKKFVQDVYLDSTQSFTYKLDAGGSANGLTAIVQGYYEER